MEATLGVHSVELILDIDDNLTQTRTDNDNFTTSLIVLEPYIAHIQIPSEISRALPGGLKVSMSLSQIPVVEVLLGPWVMMIRVYQMVGHLLQIILPTCQLH